jgi:carbamoyltransferase
MYSEKFISLFGEPRIPGAPITDYQKDLAASLQALTEKVTIHLARSLYQASGKMENLCLAGGVALNSVSNWKIWEATPFEHLYIQPAAGDAGGAMGSALYAHYAASTNVFRPQVHHSTLLGPSFSHQEIKSALDMHGVHYESYDEKPLLEKTAELISRNQIIGWFQGRMEFGPRALGSRSILANPCNPLMKDILNKRVKFREDFRPFAPAVLAKKAELYFDIPFESPYMLLVPQVKPGMGQKIPSVTHVDNSARLQTVSYTDNPLFYDLIETFETYSGVPVLINTSFNVRGEPIVCTPQDAVNCFLKTDIDFLVIGPFIAEKEI